MTLKLAIPIDVLLYFYDGIYYDPSIDGDDDYYGFCDLAKALADDGYLDNYTSDKQGIEQTINDLIATGEITIRHDTDYEYEEYDNYEDYCFARNCYGLNDDEDDD